MFFAPLSVHFPNNSITRRIQNKSRPLLPVYIIHNFIVYQFRVESSRRSGSIHTYIYIWYGRRHIIRLLVCAPKLFRFVKTRNPWPYFISAQVFVMNLVAEIFFSVLFFKHISLEFKLIITVDVVAFPVLFIFLFNREKSEQLVRILLPSTHIIVTTFFVSINHNKSYSIVCLGI